MRKGNKTERQVWRANVVCLSLIVILAAILAIRFSMFANECPSCYTTTLESKILVGILLVLQVSYLASIPVQIYKVRQSRKNKIDEDSDEGSTSY